MLIKVEGNWGSNGQEYIMPCNQAIRLMRRLNGESMTAFEKALEKATRENLGTGNVTLYKTTTGRWSVSSVLYSLSWLPNNKRGELIEELTSLEYTPDGSWLYKVFRSSIRKNQLPLSTKYYDWKVDKLRNLGIEIFE